MISTNQLPRWITTSICASALVIPFAIQALNAPKIFSDNMVLQRDRPIQFWGWGDVGETVQVSFAGQKKSTTAGADGKWKIILDALPASSEPRQIDVQGKATKLQWKNVLVGEVWICSGQSNMEWTVDASSDPKETIEAANYPLIRQFKVPHLTHTKPQTDLPGNWAACSPATAAKFTAVGYHFALELHKNLENVPIGLINTSWGGSRIEPWTDPVGFQVSDHLKPIVTQIQNADATHRGDMLKKIDEIESWAKESKAQLIQGNSPKAFPGILPDHPLLKWDKPTSIYNAMVAPLIPYTIRGAIWYQGESNNGEGMLYTEKMKALLSSWRRLWAQGDFPFLFVQLAPYRYNRPEALPGIWEAQKAALSIPNTGMAVTTDISNISDIHPRNKKEVGRRLSLWALSKTYGKSGIEFSGPLYKSSRRDGSKMVIEFDHAPSLKSMDGKPLSWFTVAGENKSFVPARAEIVGSTVVVSAENIANPQAVRFGWNELAEPNLANGVGLPASPFRTDSW